MGKIEDEFSKYFRAHSITLPEGASETMERGIIKKAGWYIKYVWGNDDKGKYLEVYAGHRMTNDRHYRIYDSGEFAELPAYPNYVMWNSEIPGSKEEGEKRYRELIDETRESLRKAGLDFDDF